MSAKFDHSELMAAYARVFRTGTTSKNKLMTGNLAAPLALVAESMEVAKYYLCESLKRRQFTPVCLGNPGTEEEMISWLQCFGAWIGRDIPKREKIVEQFALVKAGCVEKEVQFNVLNV